MPSRLLKITDKFSLENIILFLIVAMAFFFRVYELPSRPFSAETVAIFTGLRLHILDLFNFWDHVSQNFFKSLLASMGGMKFAISTYASSTIYGWLGIPLSQYWLIFFYVSLGTLVIVGTHTLGRKLSDYRSGLVGAFILAINMDQIEKSHHDGAWVTATFFVLISFIALIHYKQHPTWFRRTVFSILLAVLASMESLIILPLVVLYQLMLFVSPETSYSRKVVGCFRYLLSKENILIWLPCFIALLIHYYVYIRVGIVSHIGLFGHMVVKNQQSAYYLLNNPAWDFRTYNHYFNPGFFFSSLAVFFFLLTRWRKHNFSKLLIFSGVGFFYDFILFVLTGGKFYWTYILTPLNALFLASIWISLFDLIVDKFKNTKFAPTTRFILYAGLSLFLLIQTIGVLTKVMNRQHLILPLKSIGYYIHEYGGGSPTAYLLLPCSNAVMLSPSEFHFGTQIIDMEESFNAPRKLFCMGSKSIEETLAAYKIKDFDFYVSIYSWSGYGSTDTGQRHHNLRTPKINSQRQALLTKGVKRVAIIRDKGIILGEIYSRRNLPFLDMEMDKYDPLWDQKYANISGIVKTKWSGQASMWGTLWDLETGIQYPRDPKTGIIQYPH